MNRAVLLGGLFAFVGLISLVLFCPLGVALSGAGERLGLAAQGVEGTVWSGRLIGAQVRGVPLGDVAVSVDPLALVAGRTRLKLQTAGDAAVVGRATVTRAGKATRVDGLSGRSALAALGQGLPLAGALELTDVSAAFEDGRCREASGKAAVVADAGAALAGEVACANGALRLPLKGQGPTGATSLNLDLMPGGRYRAELRITPSGPEAAASLRLAGFRPLGSELVRVSEGAAF